MTNTQAIPEGKARVDSKTGLLWDIMPWFPMDPAGERSGASKAMWNDNMLYILAEVSLSMAMPREHGTKSELLKPIPGYWVTAEPQQK